MYSPPRYNLQIEDYLNLLQRFSGKFILGGDFNTKNTHCGSPMTNIKGRELDHAIKRQNREIHTTGKPTYWPTGKNKIDFLVSRNLSSSFMDVNEEFHMDSDRSQIVLRLSETIEKEQIPTLSEKKKLTDWDMFREKLENNQSDSYTQNQR
jgi:hypothetical protein